MKLGQCVLTGWVHTVPVTYNGPPGRAWLGSFITPSITSSPELFPFITIIYHHQHSINHSIFLSPYHSIILSLHHSIILSLYHSTILSSSLYHALIPANLAITVSHYHFITITVSLYHTIIPSLSHSISRHTIILSLHHSITVTLSLYPSVTLSLSFHYTSVYHSINVSLNHCLHLTFSPCLSDV